jgi:hypothetical protein
VGQLAPAVAVVDDDGAETRGLDDQRLAGVQGDRDAQGARAVEELAREPDRERELLAGRRPIVRRGRQRGLLAVSCPRMAPAG